MARPEKGFQFFRRRGIMGLPRKGTENCLQFCKNFFHNFFSLSPQGDGNSSTVYHVTFSGRISTYPRKGTETVLPFVLRTHLLHFNLSPQGDGNNLMMERTDLALNFNLSPQGDGNLGFQAQRQHATGISTYPRKNPLRRCAPALPKGELLQLPFTCTKLPLSGELARRKP